MFAWVVGESVVVVFQTAFEVAQGFEPRSLEFADPAVVERLERHGVQKVQLFSPAPLHGDEVCRFEHGEVLRHAPPRHVEVLAELAERLPIVSVQAIQELSTPWIG